MNIEDKLPINDFIAHGYVVAEDQSGNIIFEKNNMIVESGRKMIFKALQSITGIFADGNTDNSYKFTFSSIKFGSNKDVTTLGTTKINFIDDYVFDLKENTPSCGAMSFVFTVHINSVVPAELSELGLFAKEKGSETETETLFSRVVFDPIFVGPNAAVSSFNLTYYIYL